MLKKYHKQVEMSSSKVVSESARGLIVSSLQKILSLGNGREMITPE
jgi:hypothetical protein